MGAANQLGSGEESCDDSDVEQSLLEERSLQSSLSSLQNSSQDSSQDSSQSLLWSSLQGSFQDSLQSSRIDRTSIHISIGSMPLARSSSSRSPWEELSAIGIPELLAPVQLFAVLGVLSLLLWEGWKHCGDSIIFRFKILQQVPCPKCQFFCKSIHLRCAVRPLDALTNRAIDCSDYAPQQPEG